MRAVTSPDVEQLKTQHPELFRIQSRYLRRVILLVLAVMLYYLFFFRPLALAGRSGLMARRS